MVVIQSFIALADFLYKTKNLSHCEWSFIHQVWQTYLMELDFGKDNDEDDNDDGKDEGDIGGYQGGWHFLTPDGYFNGAPPNVLPMSKVLSIKYNGCFYLWHMLPYDLWSEPIKSHGMDP